MVAKLNTQLEQPFLEKANRKTEALRASVSRHDSSHRYTISLPLDMSFIEEAIRELLAARRVLIASYAFGYSVRGRHAQRTFEKIQVCLCGISTSVVFGKKKVI